MPMQKILLSVLGIALIILIIVGFIAIKLTAQKPAITSYAECVAAGYPILESYPEQCLTPSGRTFVNPDAVPVASSTLPTAGDNTLPRAGESEISYRDLVTVFGLEAGQIITSPLTITGEARGTWYFEASFPIRLVDGAGREVAVAIAQAQGNWMTTEYVPFRATLSFTAPRSTSTGSIVFEKDNPSGLTEHADQLRIPVRFR